MTATMLGDWKLASSENFEEYMKALGVGLVMRKLGNTTKPNVKLTQNGDEWTLQTISAIKSSEVKFRLNHEFDEETLDGRKVKTTFTLDGNRLVQTQRDKDNNVVSTISREVTDNGELRCVSIFLCLIFYFYMQINHYSYFKF
jgi:fatty acid-binding protein 3